MASMAGRPVGKPIHRRRQPRPRLPPTHPPPHCFSPSPSMVSASRSGSWILQRFFTFQACICTVSSEFCITRMTFVCRNLEEGVFFRRAARTSEMAGDRSWMDLDRGSTEWQTGMKEFLDFAFDGVPENSTVPCPCRRCVNITHKTRKDVHLDLLKNGMDPSYTCWIYHGEGHDEESPPKEPANEEVRGDDSAVHDMLSTLIRGTDVGNNTRSEKDVDANSGESSGDGGHGTNNQEPNQCAKAFFNLLKDAEKELYPGCKEATKLSFIVRLYQIKCLCGLTNKACDLVLQLFSSVLPKGHCIPDSLAKVQKIIRDLGLDYQKIHACINDCVLFRKEYASLDACPVCGESRWKTTASNDPHQATPSRRAKKPLPQKVLRYFPLTPRLQRLFMTEATSSYMQWHKEDRVEDGTMRHPADSLAWKHFDGEYGDFAKDARNIRLGVASDGFNPFGIMSVLHTIWPVILIPYNSPPWLCMKQPFWIMSMIVPGPKSAGNNIDVYLQPLIDELIELWINGAWTYDAAKKENFKMYACLLWTINDFPAYAMLSGWSTKGKLACPYCHIHTDYLWLKFGRKHCYMGHRRFLPSNHKWRRNKSWFNNKTENRDAPVSLLGRQVIQQHESFEQVTFGRTKKRKRDDSTRWHNWRKKSIFFQLPYWKDLLIRHNLDVMHIEKNICDSILGTLLDMDGKTKDSLKARLDLQHLKIRKDQHPDVKNGKYTLPVAWYALTKDEKKMLCKFLLDMKMPDGYASHIRRCVDVNGCKVSGLKTHDCHVIFQKLLPIALRGILPEKVVVPLVELSQFFSDLCSKELKAEDLVKLSDKIPEILCRLEMIFPPAFFDIMMHLPIHLAEEARLGGPVLYRWMYAIERYLRTLKGYVRNKAQPEGSIAEGYILEECMTFCSRFLDGIDTKLNRPECHERAAINEPPAGISIFGTVDYSRKGFTYETLSLDEMKQIRHYIITNCEETDSWVNEHKEELTRKNPRNVAKRHKEEFVEWFERHIMELHADGRASDLINALSRGPDHRARIYNHTFVNGFFFRNCLIEKELSTQNSAVVVKGDDNAGNIYWYGVIKKIICLEFACNKEVVMFQCDWFDAPPANKTNTRSYNKDQFGIIDVDTTQLRFADDPYILGIQAEQVFYARHVKKANWASIVRMKPRNLYAMPDEANEDLMEADADILDVGVGKMTSPNIDDDISSWCRSGVEGASGDASEIQHIQPVDDPEDDQLESDDDVDDDDTYMNDGHVAPLLEEPDDDHGFFV